MLSHMHQETGTVSSNVLACCCLHNLMSLRFPIPNFQKKTLNQEDMNHNVFPGALRENANITDLDTIEQLEKQKHRYLT